MWFDGDNFLLLLHIFVRKLRNRMKEFWLHNSWMNMIWTFPRAFWASHQGRGKCDSCLANIATLSELRNHNDCLETRHWWERNISFSTYRRLFLFSNEKRNLVEDHDLDNQILLELFLSSIWRMAQKTLLLKCKFSAVNIAQWARCFILEVSKLHTDDLNM